MGKMKEGSANGSLGAEIVGRINELAAISETPEHLARVFLTREHRAAAELRDAGRWDGPLGVITAISCVADLHQPAAPRPSPSR